MISIVLSRRIALMSARTGQALSRAGGDRSCSRLARRVVGCGDSGVTSSVRHIRSGIEAKTSSS